MLLSNCAMNSTNIINKTKNSNKTNIFINIRTLQDTVNSRSVWSYNIRMYHAIVLLWSSFNRMQVHEVGLVFVWYISSCWRNYYYCCCCYCLLLLFLATISYIFFCYFFFFFFVRWFNAAFRLLHNHKLYAACRCRKNELNEIKCDSNFSSKIV